MQYIYHHHYNILYHLVHVPVFIRQMYYIFTCSPVTLNFYLQQYSQQFSSGDNVTLLSIHNNYSLSIRIISKTSVSPDLDSEIKTEMIVAFEIKKIDAGSTIFKQEESCNQRFCKIRKGNMEIKVKDQLIHISCNP